MPLDKNWMLHPPFGDWHESVIRLIRHLRRLQYHDQFIFRSLDSLRPSEGWSKTDIEFCKQAIKDSKRLR